MIDTDKGTTLEGWIDRNTPNSRQMTLLLQMDIEGAEFCVLLSTPTETLKRFRIMIIEFHLFHKIADPEQFT